MAIFFLSEGDDLFTGATNGVRSMGVVQGNGGNDTLIGGGW